MALLTSHANVEWFTPPHVIDAARQVLGGIDLDPASCAAANATVQATTFFDQEADGLSRDWSGRVWLNPPFSKVRGKSQQALWTRKLLQEHHAGRVPAAVLLVNDARGYRWFNDLLWRRYPVCLVDELLAFRRGDGARATHAKQASCLFYLGPEVERFREVCEPLGEVIIPSGRRRGQLVMGL
jgi:ParB family chromosome partitioning protein